MKAKKIDQTIRAKIKENERKSSVFLNWEKQESWVKIRHLLDHKQTKVIVWMCSMAATLSIVLGEPVHAIKNWLDTSIDSFEITQEQKKLNNTIKDPIELEQDETSQEIVIDGMKSKKIIEPISCELIAKPEILKIENNIKIESASIKSNNKTTINSKAFMNYSAAAIGTGVRLNVQKRILSNEFGVNTFGILIDYAPLYSLNNKINEHSGKINHELYVGVLAGNENKWYVTASYNVLNKQEIDSMPAIRLAYLHRISTRLYFGPEVKFSSSFKQVYPSITLTLG